MYVKPLERKTPRPTALRAFAVSACLLAGGWPAAGDDGKSVPTVSFTAAAQANAEGVTSVTVTVELSALSSREVQVPLAFTGDAVDPDDYSPGTGTLTIPAGQMSADLTLTVVDDDLDETSELIDIKMGTPTGARRGDVTLHTVVIQDDDPPPGR